MIKPIRNHSFDLNSTTKIVQSVSITGTFLAVSPKWLEVTGYTLEEVLNKPVSSMLEGSSLKHLQKNFPHLTKYGFVDNVPFTLLTKEGKSKKFILNGCGEIDEDGKFSHSYCELTPIDILDDNIKLAYFEKERFYKSTEFLKKNIMEIVKKEYSIDGFLESLYPVLKEPVDITDVIIEDKKNKKTSSFLLCKKLFKENNYNGFTVKRDEFPQGLSVSEETSFLIFLKIDSLFSESEDRLIIIGVDSYKLIQSEWYEAFLSISQVIEFAMGNIMLKEQEKRFQQQSRLAQMGEMISMIAHQWRQPLASISAVTITMQLTSELEFINLEDKEEAIKYKEYVNKSLKQIDGYVQNLTHTIDDFRNFYQPNKQSKTVKLEEVIDPALKLIEPSLINHDINIVKEYNSDEMIEIYDREVMQVVLNLVHNAKENFKEKQIKDRKIIIKTENRTISVCDNGGGIPEDIIDRIFDPYFSTKDEKNGTGLGLYMSKTIVENHHNGKLHVKNTDDGVCFILELGVI